MVFDGKYLRESIIMTFQGRDAGFGACFQEKWRQFFSDSRLAVRQYKCGASDLTTFEQFSPKSSMFTLKWTVFRLIHSKFNFQQRFFAMAKNPLIE